MARIFIWGASGHAHVVADIIRLIGKDTIVGFIDDVSPQRRGEAFLQSRVLGGREQIEVLRQSRVRKAIVAVGDCAARLRLSHLLLLHGFELVTAIHPRATVAPNASVGPGSVVCAGAAVGPGAQIGYSGIINTCASVDHDCSIGDGVHVGPGAHLGGLVRVGSAAWIAIGATVVDRIEIGDGAVVGAGAVVLKNVPRGALVFGVPARRRTARQGTSKPGETELS